MTKPRTAADRHVAAKQALPKLERERDEITAQWRQCLLDDDESAVERCERRLDLVARKLRRSQALIDLLVPQVQREQQAQQQKTWPSSRPDAEAALAACESARVRYEAIPQIDRSANHQTQCDALRQRSYALSKLIKSLPEEKIA